MPGCDPAPIDNAAAAAGLTVDWTLPGDHGDTVPVGITARFQCNAGTGPATSSFFCCGVVDKFVVDIETDL